MSRAAVIQAMTCTRGPSRSCVPPGASVLRRRGLLCAACASLVALLGGCRASPPVRFYALDPVPAQHAAVAPSAAVQLAAINIPPELDRQELVRESAPNTLEISDRSRWGAPLGEMVRDVLTQDLLRRLPAGKVILPRATAPPGSYEIAVDILRFEAGSSGAVVFDGGWSLFRLGSDEPLAHHHFHIEEAAAAGAAADHAAQVKAMSNLLGRLADDLVAGLPEASAKQPQ